MTPDLRNFTMADAATLLGLRAPVHHRADVCAECGGDLTWGVEITMSAPHGTGYDVEMCEECGAVSERTWAGR